MPKGGNRRKQNANLSNSEGTHLWDIRSRTKTIIMVRHDVDRSSSGRRGNRFWKRDFVTKARPKYSETFLPTRLCLTKKTLKIWNFTQFDVVFFLSFGYSSKTPAPGKRKNAFLTNDFYINAGEPLWFATDRVTRVRRPVLRSRKIVAIERKRYAVGRKNKMGRLASNTDDGNGRGQYLARFSAPWFLHEQTIRVFRIYTQ